MMRYAQFHDGEASPFNFCDIDAGSDWDPPEGQFIVQTDDAQLDWTYEDGVWTAPPPPPEPRRMLRKSLIQQRLIEAGLMDRAYLVLTSQPAAFARWFAPDHPEVYADDPDALAMLAAIGADAAAVMAP